MVKRRPVLTLVSFRESLEKLLQGVELTQMLLSTAKHLETEAERYPPATGDSVRVLRMPSLADDTPDLRLYFGISDADEILLLHVEPADSDPNDWRSRGN